jgi:glycerophosphoryl diester phosphodiesterase
VDVKARRAADVGRAVAAHGHRSCSPGFDDRNRRAALEATAAAAGADVLPASSGGRTAIALLLLASALRRRRVARRVLRGLDAVQIPERFGAAVDCPGTRPRRARRGGRGARLDRERPERMRTLVSAGADGIVTDRADVAIRTLSPR